MTVAAAAYKGVLIKRSKLPASAPRYLSDGA